MRILKLLILTVVAFFWINISLQAQPGDPDGGDKPGTPLTGVEWLLLAGAGLGAKKIIDKKRRK